MRTLLLSLGLCAAGLGLVGSGCATNRESSEAAASAGNQILSDPISEATPFELPSAEAHLLDQVQTNASVPSAPFEGEGWRPLFNGKDLAGWEEANFGGGGALETGSGMLILNMGEPFTGVRYTNAFPSMDYEIALDAMRVLGADFFCGLTLPVGESFFTLIVGGWGGSLVGISSLNGLDASENETTTFQSFENNQWYRIRVRVTGKRIEAWIDQRKMVDLVTTTKLIHMRPGEIETCKPLGLATWQTAAAYRQIQFRAVSGPADPPPRTLY